MQWYEATSKKLEVGHRYSHQELIRLLKSDYPQMRNSSYHWAVCGMLKSGNLTKVARNVYVVQNEREKPLYRPAYPSVCFTVFETALMNDFLNHLVAQNTVFIQVDKDVSVFVFRFLQELGYEHLLYKPKKADYALYWEKDCIVVTDMISEAPLSATAPHEICLEKMLVDMYCDKLISSAYSKSEYPEVLKQAMETYHIESTKMMRYARRRGREDEMKKILEEIEDAEA